MKATPNIVNKVVYPALAFAKYVSVEKIFNQILAYYLKGCIDFFLQSLNNKTSRLLRQYLIKLGLSLKGCYRIMRT